MIQTENILIEAVRQVFGTMLIAEAVPDHSDALGQGSDALVMWQKFDGDIRGSLRLSGRPEAVAVIYEQLLGTPIAPTELDELRDALGELLNMVGGLCKRELAEEDIAVNLSIPVKADQSPTLESLHSEKLQTTLVGFELRGLEQRLVFRLVLDR